MNREVELVLSGLHDTEGASDKNAVKTAQTAQYFKRNDSHYLLYEEDMEGFDGACKSRIKFRDNLLELTRQGAVEIHMIFDEHPRHVVPYNTPSGQLMLGIEPRRAQLEEQEDQIRVTVEYTLDQEGEPFSESCLKLHIREKQ